MCVNGKMADLGDKEKITRQEIEELKDQAKEFLDSRYFYAASDLYARILNNNPNDKDGHIGLLLTENKISSEEYLIRHYQDLYSEEEYEIKLACEKEEEHIEEMCERYCIPGYLEKEEIRKAYDFDLTYKSNVFSREQQKKEIEKIINENEHLFWLKDRGFKEIQDILRVYDRRIEEAKENERENIQRIKSEYQRFLYKAYSDVKDLSEKAKQKKEEDYRDLITKFEKSEDIDELRDIALRFERFNGYKDAKTYVSSCQKKIEEVYAKMKDESFKTVIDNSLAEARAALVTGKFAEAYEEFTKIASMDAENEEAHLGILMARSKTSDTDELFAYYKDLYNEDHGEILEACEEDREHIEEMADRYFLPDYLEKETIYEKYLYDRSYKSLLNARIRQQERFKEEVSADPVFSWLRKHGSEDTKNRISDLSDIYSLRVKEAADADKKKVEQIRNDYQRFLFKTYSSIKNLYKKACDKKEESYKQLLRSFDLAENENELNELIGKFESFGEYKECGRYIILCREKIKELKEAKQADSFDHELETTLIAGNAYLASGNTKLADEAFSKVLSMDPDNPRAYLGILMLETGSKDVDELASYYTGLYNDDERKIVDACKEETDHIRAMADKYVIPGYLEKETIEQYYDFDRSFETLTASRERQRDQFNEELRMNPLLAKAAAGKDPEIISFLEKVRNGYEARIRESKEEDEKQISSLRHIYEVYLEETDKTVIRIHDEKQKLKDETDEASYLKNVEEFNRNLSEEELEALCEKFDLDYKDGPVYIKKCKDRIKQLRKERQADKLKTLLENGTALLESELFDEAKKRFKSYLEIDPDNEEAHLKHLMAVKNVSDVTSLFGQYKDLYSEEMPETRTAVEENAEHIEDIAERCNIPGLLEKEAIRKRYVFDGTYKSLLNSRLEQKRQIGDELSIDPELAWLNENGSENVKEYIDDLLDTYDQRVEEAEEEDRRLSEAIRKEYRAFVRDTDREVRSLYNELNRERNRKLKEQEKERRESERRRKEEEERQRKFRQEEELRLRQLKEDLERKERLLLEEQERIETARKEEELRKQREEIEEKKRRQQELLRQEAEKRKASVSQNVEMQNALAQRERLEKQAWQKAEKERQKLERQEQARQAKLLKEEERRRKEEEKAQKALEKPKKERKPFRPNFALIAAALSLGLLTFVVYTFVIEPSNKYKNALELVDSGEYDEAIAVFEELGSYKDSEYQIKETTYKKADALYKDGEVIEAAAIFNNLRFNDSEDRAKAIKEELIEDAKIGDTIYFGDYEQDGDTDNGKEMIEWIVLDEQEGSILVISRYAIEAQKYNATSDEVYWENSSLRSWLNGRFPDNAFSREDPSDVLQTTLTNFGYPEHDEDVGFDELIAEEYETRDRVFLLDQTELETYFADEDSRICQATEYSIQNGVAANADNECNWWLRQPGNEQFNTTLIVRSSDGSLSDSMYEITNGVRPAMWIKNQK